MFLPIGFSASLYAGGYDEDGTYDCVSSSVVDGNGLGTTSLSPRPSGPPGPLVFPESSRCDVSARQRAMAGLRHGQLSIMSPVELSQGMLGSY